MLRLDPTNEDARSFLAAGQREPGAAVGSRSASGGAVGEGTTGAGETPALPERAEALRHLDLALAELREMKMRPALERALRHKEVLKA